MLDVERDADGVLDAVPELVDSVGVELRVIVLVELGVLVELIDSGTLDEGFQIPVMDATSAASPKYDNPYNSSIVRRTL